MAVGQFPSHKLFWKSSLYFPGIIWLCSRLFIWISMLYVAPHLPVPSGGDIPSFGWSVFNGWDGGHYQHIALNGYEYADDGKEHNVAFFPLFPLIVKAIMSWGVSFEVAGTVVNNLAFAIALYSMYFFVKQYCGQYQAQWTTAVLAFAPGSMFAGVIYTEGLYLALSIAALRAFDNQNYGRTFLWGAMATATRPTGLAIIPAFMIAAWKQRKPFVAYLSGLGSSVGVLLYCLYCKIRFGEPLAFIHAQRGWRSSVGFDWKGWGKMIMQIFTGSTSWRINGISSFVHPLLLSLIIISGFLLWRFRFKLGSSKTDCGLGFLIICLWLLAGDPLINTVSVIGSIYLLWWVSFGRKSGKNALSSNIRPVTMVYGLCGMGLILASGGTMSLSRIAYGIFPTSIALGIFLSDHPRVGYSVIFLFNIILICTSVRFAQGLWVG